MQTVALILSGDRFEDFFDKIGITLELFRTRLTGGWLFNYIKALEGVDIRTVIVYASARVSEPVRFSHWDTGAAVWVLPSPWLHIKARNVVRRRFPHTPSLEAASSYLASPLRSLAKVLREERCDAILCQEYEDPRFDACLLLGTVLRLPVFATYQGASRTRSALERAVRRVTVPRAKGLIIPSKSERDRVQQTYRIPDSTIADIPTSVEAVPVRDRNETRASLGIAPQTCVVAWHGRVQIETKGLDVLADAWQQICTARPDADMLLLFVGSGRDEAVFGERLRSVPKTRWVNRYVLDRQELWSYLAAADLYTIASRREGFAVAILEAMACGLPIVASDAPGVIDVIPRGPIDGGLIVPAGDATALAGALLRVFDDPELAANLRACARRRVQADFSPQVVGDRLRQLLFPTRS